MPLKFFDRNQLPTRVYFFENLMETMIARKAVNNRNPYCWLWFVRPICSSKVFPVNFSFSNPEASPIIANLPLIVSEVIVNPNISYA